jgi:hypothetical protein
MSADRSVTTLLSFQPQPQIPALTSRHCQRMPLGIEKSVIISLVLEAALYGMSYSDASEEPHIY